MQKKRFARLGLMASTLAAVAIGVTAVPASASDSVSCASTGSTECWSGTLPANGNHQVCFGGHHTALAYWGRAELWDADTGVMVGSIPTNQWGWNTTCVGGLYGSHYRLHGTGSYFYGEAWN
ncbi:hypothetical protein [Streptomyces sp. NPDC004788]